MSAQPEPVSLLSGLEEAALYHDAGQHGFFALLWCDPDRERPVGRGRPEQPSPGPKLTPKVGSAHETEKIVR